jgi:hypothetical protein
VDTNATSNIDGVTALMLASREGHKGIAVDLIEAGADASAVSGNGWSALLFAAAAGRRDTSAILLQRGSVDVNAVDKRSGGISALTVASRSGQTAVVRLLVDLGATIDSRDIAAGMTPLMHASKHDAAAAMNLLIAHSADINMRDKHGLTPLMHACIHGSTDAIVELINNFADVNITDKETKSAFDHALKHNHRSVFLSALINVRSTAKVPFLSWLERECPKMSRGTDLGNPSLYLNAFLYGSNGLYAGLYFRNREYDYELVSGLIMLAAAFKRSAEADPECAVDMTVKLHHVDLMLAECLRARSMVADETIANSLLLHKPAMYRTELDVLLLTPALQSGPLALYIDIKLSNFLACPPIDAKLRKLYHSCIKRPPGFKTGQPPSLLGCLSTSSWLRCRYCPRTVLVMAEFPKFLVLLLICVAVNSVRTYEACQLIVLMTVCMLFYELGEMEDKLNADWPSILLDRAVLIQRRWYNFINHFNENIWKRCDGVMLALLILWILDWVANGLHVAMPVLSLVAIPTAFSLLRVIVADWDGIGLRILTCVDAIWIVGQYFVIIAFTGVGVGVAMLMLFRSEASSTGFDTSTMTYVSLFESLYGMPHLTDIANASNHGIGLFVLSAFTIWVSTVVFSMIIAELCSRLPEMEARNKDAMAYWRAKMLQQCSLVNERSPLCMLPAPLNLATTALYIPHYFILKASLLIPGRTHHLSLAGWVADIVLGMMFLPVAYGTAFFSTLQQSSYSRHTKILCLVFSPLIIAFNTFILLLTFGWIPPPVSLLTNSVKWSRMNRICYEDRRDCVVKIGLPEVDYAEPEDLMERLRRKKRRKEGEGEDDEEESPSGYEGFVDMDERNFHYYAMLLLMTALRGFNIFSRFYLALRDVMRGGATVSAESKNGPRGSNKNKRKTTAGIDDADIESDEDDDEDDDATDYNEIGAPVARAKRGTTVMRGADNRSINSLPFIGDMKPGQKFVDEDYSQHVIPAYADDAYHYAVPQHLGVVFSLAERQKIFEIVIPEVVSNVDITHPEAMAPPDKSLKQFHSTKDIRDIEVITSPNRSSKQLQSSKDIRAIIQRELEDED